MPKHLNFYGSLLSNGDAILCNGRLESLSHVYSSTKPLTRSQADLIFKEACKRVRIKGVSTHSMRRTALTNLSNAGVPLRVIMEISGHKICRASSAI